MVAVEEQSEPGSGTSRGTIDGNGKRGFGGSRRDREKTSATCERERGCDARKRSFHGDVRGLSCVQRPGRQSGTGLERNRRARPHGNPDGYFGSESVGGSEFPNVECD